MQCAAYGSKSGDGGVTRAVIAASASGGASMRRSFTRRESVDGPAAAAIAAPSQLAISDSVRAWSRERRGRRSHGNAETLGVATKLVRFYPTSAHHLSLIEEVIRVHERRLGYRIPFESMVTSYVQDRPIRGLATNLSDSGLNMSTISMVAPPPGVIVPLEIDLPGMGESIWASGRICYRQDDRMASGLGVRFIAMAKSQARMVRDFCIEMRRKNLGSILARIRA